MQNPRLATLAASVAIVGLTAAGALVIAGQDSAARPPAPTRITTAADDTTIPTWAAPSSSPTTLPIAGIQPDAVGAERAGEIAVGRVGGGRVASVERELEHGRVEWKVRVVRAGVTHEVRVAADSGTITRSDTGPGALPVPRADDHGRGLDDRRSDDRRSDDHGSGGHGSDDRRGG